MIEIKANIEIPKDLLDNYLEVIKVLRYSVFNYSSSNAPPIYFKMSKHGSFRISFEWCGRNFTTPEICVIPPDRLRCDWDESGEFSEEFDGETMWQILASAMSRRLEREEFARRSVCLSIMALVDAERWRNPQEELPDVGEDVLWEWYDCRHGRKRILGGSYVGRIGGYPTFSTPGFQTAAIRWRKAPPPAEKGFFSCHYFALQLLKRAAGLDANDAIL